MLCKGEGNVTNKKMIFIFALACAKRGRGRAAIRHARVRAFTLLNITGDGQFEKSGLFALDPFAGIIQIRFIGYLLRLLSEPPHGNSTVLKIANLVKPK